MSLLYRHQQILQALFDAKDGATSRDILSACLSMRPNEVPNDINQMCTNIQALRRREFLTTEDTIGAKLHKITQKGIEALEAELETSLTGETQVQAIPEKPQGPENENIEQSPLTKAFETVLKEPPEKVEQPKIPDIDMLAEFDKACAILREAMLQALAEQPRPEPWPRINDKQAKIELLEKFENMPLIEIWACELLADIRRDLDQFDAA